MILPFRPGGPADEPFRRVPRRRLPLLRLHDPQAARDLLTYRESERAREQEGAARQAAEEVLQRESAARQAAEARVAKLEARLRDVERAAGESESKEEQS